MSHSSQVEIERKYDVDADTVAPNLIGVGAIALVDGPGTAELAAVYFDTARLDLAGARMALRRREGGNDAGWHLKIARPGAEGRTELHWPLTAQHVVPDAAREQVRDIIGDAELVPVARVGNSRSTLVLLDAARHRLAELCDDHVHADDMLTGAHRAWREWEVELLAAAPDTVEGRTRLLDGIERELLAVGARASASSSKLARALGIDAL